MPPKPKPAQPSDGPVLITGATGLVGRALAEALIAEGAEVRGLVRHSSKAAPLHDLGVDLFVGDVTDPDTLSAPMSGVDTVYHCAAYVGDWGSAERFHRVNVGGTEHVAAAAVEAGVRRLVHLSTVAVYGKQPRPEMTEALPFEPCGDPYYDSKIAAERAAFAVAEEIEVTALRPGVIYGPRDKLVLPRLIPAMKRLPIPRPLGLDTIANFAYVQNVVAQCVVQAAHPAAAGHAFNCIDREPMRLVNLLRLVATKTGGRQPQGVVLPQVMQLTALTLETIWKTLDIQTPPPLTRFAVDGLLLIRPFSMEKARWLLDFIPPYTTRQGLLETLAVMGEEEAAGGDADWGHGWEEDEEDEPANGEEPDDLIEDGDLSAEDHEPE